jgi:arabinose-5-phosphate isomerase
MSEALDLTALGREIVQAEAAALAALAERLGREFSDAVSLLQACRGRIITAGMGKSGHIARKMAATFSSTGAPAIFVHPAESAHGDLGVITGEDVVILLSKSGESAEIIAMLPFIKRIGAKIVSIGNSSQSVIARSADAAIVLGIASEACPMDLAPTTSTTAMLAIGDALAIVLMRVRSFTRDDFARNHPGGRLGRLLLHVEDLMETRDLPFVTEGVSLREALMAILNHRNRGIVMVTDEGGRLSGVICDGDLKRLMLKHEHLLDLPVRAVMTQNPQTIAPLALVGEALARMEGRFTSLVVIDEIGRPLGLLHIHDILEARLV